MANRSNHVNRIQYTAGQILGKCVYLREAGKTNRGQRKAVFKCECGNEFEAVILEVKKNHTNSCGCGIHRHAKIRKDINHVYKSEYVSWCSMKYRCNNPRCDDYKHYGGRGIKIHEPWIHSFEAFLKDMGPKPSPKHTLERVRVNEDYGPENCVWLINVEQPWNRRNSIMLTHNGKTQSISFWAKELGIPYKQIKSRIDQGFSHERALCHTKYDSRGRPESVGKKVLYNGEWLTMRETSQETGIQYNTIRSRLSRKLDPITGLKLGWPLR